MKRLKNLRWRCPLCGMISWLTPRARKRGCDAQLEFLRVTQVARDGFDHDVLPETEALGRADVTELLEELDRQLLQVAVRVAALLRRARALQ